MSSNHSSKSLATSSPSRIDNESFAQNYLKIPPAWMWEILSQNTYTRKEIKKKSGTRVLYIPHHRLLNIQRRLLQHFERLSLTSLPFSKKLRPLSCTHSFVKGRSILTHAKVHRGKKYILRVDLKNFFPSISKDHVFKLMQSIGFTKEVSKTITRITCFQDSLPQGAATSPYISNLVFKKLDFQIQALCKSKKWHIHYSRYADDLTFSKGGLFDYLEFIEELKKILEPHGFNINQSKTLWMPYNHRQMITGIIVNDGFNIPRRSLKRLRSVLHQCQKYTVLGAISKDPNLNEKEREEIRLLMLYKESPDDTTLQNYFVFTTGTVLPQRQGFVSRLHKTVKNEIAVKEKRYLKKIAGRIEFYRQVIEFNDQPKSDRTHPHRHPDDIVHNRLTKRRAIYLDLIAQYNNLSEVSLPIRRKEYAQRKIIASDAEKKRMIREEKTLAGLQQIIRHLAKTDIRFFLLKVKLHSTVEVLRGICLNTFKIPLVTNDDMLGYILSQKDSSSGVLGPLLHLQPPKDDFSSWYKTTRQQAFSKDLYNAFQQTFLDIYKEIHKTSMDVFLQNKDVCQRLKKHKQELRYGKSKNVGTVLKKQYLQDIFKKCKNQHTTSASLDCLLDFSEIKTFVPSIHKALEAIFRSMLERNTEGTISIHIEQYHMINSIREEMPTVRICIFDRPKIPKTLDNSKTNRWNLIGGDTVAIIEQLYGLADYSVIGHFEKAEKERTIEPLQINLLEESEPRLAPQHLLDKSPNGFFHIIELPQIYIEN